MPELPTGTVTFLFTDIEGSTALWEQYPEAMRLALVRHDALAEEVVAEHQGYVVRPRGEGDSRFAVFARATDAVAAAASLQLALYSEPWPTPTPLKVRMGLHTGEADWRDGDYYGSAVNRCARLRAVAHGGQTLVSLATEQLVRDHLPPETFLRDLGQGGLRGLRRAEHAFQLVIPDLPADFPPLKDFDPRYLEPIDGTTTLLDNPYQGLRAFHEADAPNFFGREALTERLLARLGEAVPLARFLAVVGPSGSGKSSVVRAGVVPALRRGALPGSERWLLAELIPGAHPLEELEAVLLSIAVNPPASLLEQLREDERGLLRAAKRVLPRDDMTDLVLVIDQFEEVFTLVADEATRVHFLMSLHAAVTDPRSRVRVLITLRADFYDRPLLYPDPGELLRQRTEVVLPLAAEELEWAIVRPAARAGATLEPELVAAIVKDVGEQPGALPLLQYALTELFERRDGRVLTLTAYRASGGVFGAVSRRAEEIYTGLTKAEQAAARQLFLRLVTLGEGVEDTRRRVRRAELGAVVADAEGMDAVIAAFDQHRLLTFDQDRVTHGPTVEVAHEALIRTWVRLRGWLEASRANLLLERQLLAAASDWVASANDVSFLATGTRLAQFAMLAQQEDVALTGEERAFLAMSQRHAEQEQAEREGQRQRELVAERRAAARLRRRALYLAGVLVVALIAALAAVGFARRSQLHLVRSEQVRLSAQAGNMLGQGTSGEVPALLALRSLRYGYSAQADAVLLHASERGFLRQRFGGGISVAAVAFSPDGTTILTGNADHTATLWDAASGRELRSLVGHSDGVTSVAFSPDGQYVLTGSHDNTARLWEAATGRVVQAFPRKRDDTTESGSSDEMTSVAFSPDGQYVLTGSAANTARLWEAATGRVVQAFVRIPDNSYYIYPMTSIAFSPDGRYVLTGSSDKTAVLWDPQTGKQLRRFAGHTDEVLAVAFSPDGRWVATSSSDQTARLWNMASGQELRQFVGHTGLVSAVAFSPDGRYLLTGGVDKTARLWEAASGRQVHQYLGHTQWLSSVAFSPDGRFVLAGGEDGSALLWDTLPPTEPLVMSGHTGGVNSAAFSPDGRYLLTSSGDKTVRLWDRTTGAEVRTIGYLLEGSAAAIFAPDGQSILTTSWRTAYRWNVEFTRRIGTFWGHANALTRIAFSPDGRQVLTGSDDQRAILWDSVSSKILHVFSGHTASVRAVAFSPDGRYVLTGSADRTARLWDAATGQEVRQLTGHADSVAGVAFSPDGAYVLTGSYDHTAKLWETATGRDVRTLAGHTDALFAVAFSADGRSVLTGSRDQTAKLWDAQTGHELRTYTGHTGVVNDVAFAQDGRSILTASDDGTARLWRTDFQAVVDFVCAQLPRDLTPEERKLYGVADTTPACPHS